MAVSDVERHLADDPAIDPDDLRDLLTQLMDRGFLSGFPSLGGLNTVFLEPKGKELALRVRDLREDPVARARQLQDDYLRWLYTEVEQAGGSPTATDYLATKPNFHGVPYTDRELVTAGVRLKEGGFIDGDGRYAYPAPAQPRLTPLGRRVVERGRSVHDEPESPATVQHFTTTVHGNANIANASPGATQSLTINTEWAAAATEVLDAVDQSLATLPTDMTSAVAALVEDARSAVAENSPTRAKRALNALGSFLGDTASGALGGLLSAQVLALVAALTG